MTDGAVRIVARNDVRIGRNDGPVIVRAQRSTRVRTGGQGVMGPPGEDGGGVEVRIAATAVSGHRVVKVNDDGSVDYADAGTLGDASIVLGLSLNAAIVGANVNVRELGEVVEAGWSWTAGLPVWLGATGHLTQTPPALPESAFALQIGFAIAADTLFVRPEPVILL